MNGGIIVQSALLAIGAVGFGVWLYRNVWTGPKVVRAVVVEKTVNQTSTRLPDILPGSGGVFPAGTTHVLVLKVDGIQRRFTANDESWRKVDVQDEVKVWIQNETHVTGVLVLNRRK